MVKNEGKSMVFEGGYGRPRALSPGSDRIFEQDKIFTISTWIDLAIALLRIGQIRDI